MCDWFKTLDCVNLTNSFKSSKAWGLDSNDIISTVVSRERCMHVHGWNYPSKGINSSEFGETKWLNQKGSFKKKMDGVPIYTIRLDLPR